MSSKLVFRERQLRQQSDARAVRRYESQKWRRESDAVERSVLVRSVVR